MAQAASELERSMKEHFLHPRHPLVKTNKDTRFICDACWTQGRGTRYRCDPCDFDLHIYCAHCPETILSPLHPQHGLTLVRKLCGICAEFIRGQVFYRCWDCEVDFHTSCLGIKENIPWWPRRLSSPLHPQHMLTWASPRCDDCRESLHGILYRCWDCRYDLHPLCHQRTMLTVTTTTSTTSTTDEHLTLYFFMHPEHELTPLRAPDGCFCGACGDPVAVNEDCYGCDRCGFHAHRRCTRAFKPAVRDAVHRAHLLHYHISRADLCIVCKERCVQWRYHCTLCNVHVHRGCLKGPSSPPPQNRDGMAPRSRALPSGPPVLGNA